MNHRSNAYQFTVSKDDADGFELIEMLKTDIRELNSKHDSKFRVVLKARLGKNNPNADLYRLRRRMGNRNAYQTIQMCHGSRFDVYIHRR
jgi:hypothetical protein